MRSAIVMTPNAAGPFDILLRLVRFHLGGHFGNGKMFVSWIHDQDFVRTVDWLLQHDELEGPVNLAAPNPLTNSEFMREIRKAWGVSFGLPATKWMLELGHSFSAVKLNSCSKAVGLFRPDCSSRDSPFSIPIGPQQLKIFVPDGGNANSLAPHFQSIDRRSTPANRLNDREILGPPPILVKLSNLLATLKGDARIRRLT